MDAAWRDVLQALAPVVGGAVDILPEVLGATVLLVLGGLLARFLSIWSARLIAHLPWIGKERAVDAALRRMGIERSLGEIVGVALFWVVFVIFLTAATEVLGLPVLATWLRGVSDYLPRVLLALLITLVGLFGGGLAREAITAAVTIAGIEQRELLGRLAQIVIVFVALVTAIDQLGVDSRFFSELVVLLVGAAIGGTALAFGLGARSTVSNIIARHYVQQIYRVGQMVRVGEAEGRIAEITATAVVLETPGKRIVVPAKEFTENISVLITEGA